MGFAPPLNLKEKVSTDIISPLAHKSSDLHGDSIKDFGLCSFLGNYKIF